MVAVGPQSVAGTNSRDQRLALRAERLLGREQRNVVFASRGP
jgi:hypothetical protein